MSARPQTFTPDHSAPLDFLTTRDADVLAGHFGAPPRARSEEVQATEPGPDREVARRVLRDLAAERADGASATLMGAMLLMVASSAVALLSVEGTPSLALGAAVLFAGAAGVVVTVRLRLQRELAIVAEAQGLDAAEAAREARRLAIRALRLE